MYKIINNLTKEVINIVETEKDLVGYHKYPYRIFEIREDRTLNIKIKRLTDTAKIPSKADSGSAGYDLYADIQEPVEIAPHQTEKIGTGIAVEIPEGYFGAIFARSGLATKQGLRPANCTGVCDPSYRGEYIVAMHNDSTFSKTVEPGDRIAQLVFIPYANVNFIAVDELSDTERGEGGFGHSGTK